MFGLLSSSLGSLFSHTSASFLRSLVWPTSFDFVWSCHLPSSPANGSSLSTSPLSARNYVKRRYWLPWPLEPLPLLYLQELVLAHTSPLALRDQLILPGKFPAAGTHPLLAKENTGTVTSTLGVATAKILNVQFIFVCYPRNVIPMYAVKRSMGIINTVIIFFARISFKVHLFFSANEVRKTGLLYIWHVM